MNHLKFFLKKSPFFNILSKDEIPFLFNHVEKRHFSSGEVILNQGKQGSHLYLILSGTVSVATALPGKPSKKIGELIPGQVFGEVSFLTDTLTTASIFAEGSCECLVFSRDTLNMLRLAFPNAAYRFEQEIVLQAEDKIGAQINEINNLLQTIPVNLQRHSEHARYLPTLAASYKTLAISDLVIAYVAKLNFFNELNKDQILALLPYFHVRLYDKGYRLLASDLESQKLALIYSGATMLFIKMDDELNKSIAVFGIGELLIQNSMFPNFNRMAEYVTSEKSIMLELDFEIYKNLYESQPDIFYTISQHIHKTIVSAVYILNRQLVRMNIEYEALIK